MKTFLLIGLTLVSAVIAEEPQVKVEEIAEAAVANLTEEQKELLMMDALVDKETQRHTGEITVLDGKVNLSIPEDFYFVDEEDTKRILEEAWMNPPSTIPLAGMIFPKQYAPMDENAWCAVIEYVEDGHVKDEDAADINYDEMLSQMKKDTAAESEQRVGHGYPSLELMGWASPPFYDAAQKKLHWAKEIKFGEEEDHTLNYNIRVLGRKGYLQINFIAGMNQLVEIQESVQPVLEIAEFTEGNAYADFSSGTDKVAAYGIGGLVAGKALAKLGFFAKFVMIFKKGGWVAILFIVGGMGRMMKGSSAAPAEKE